ncbi:MAG: TonB-dependent receptor [Bacteroidetes bacterium]|nr:TonB-dependent receptor [Bacteroidota bacterium]
MKKIEQKEKNVTRVIAMLIAMLLLCVEAYSQTTQTVRGRVIDEVSKTPLIGVTVQVLGNFDSPLGSATDGDGFFAIPNVPTGRQTLKVSYVGYEEQIIPNVIVTAGKEVIFNFALTESVAQLNEVVIVANSKDDKTATNNDLAAVSARSFNIDDTKRYAGALGDPSRMAANFAGVIGGNDSRNDIVVRGNSPTGMLWQLEGLNIPNPNHFGALNSTGGPVSMLNNNNLDKSDFITSAFPAQYGNAIAGAFDIRLREGNNQKIEKVAQIGFNGFELGMEGPFSKSSKSSFIVNYRYSTLGVFQALGIEFGTGGNTPNYQDLNYKLTFPTKNNGKFTVFGILGTSSIDLLGSKINKDDLRKPSSSDLYGNENQDSYPRYGTTINGVSFEKNLSKKTFAKFTLGYSTTREKFTSDSLTRNGDLDVVSRFQRAQAKFNTEKASFVFFTRTKFNSKNSLTSGVYIDYNTFNLFNRDLFANVNKDTVRVDISDNNTLSQAYTQWMHRFSTKFSFSAGLHAQHYSLNNQVVVEPRGNVTYQMTGNKSLSLGYGLHHQTPAVYTSYAQTKTPTGVIYSNKDLDFIASNHYVLTYDWNLSETLRLKAEAYYQELSNVPVERNASSFSSINTGVSFGPSDKVNLVNRGSGKNYGIELTLERFFNKGYYFLFTTSVFDSKYKGSDNIERNTAYNTQYVVNALGGKEFRVGRNKNFLSLNLKVTTIGGRYLTPLNFAASQLQGQAVYDESSAFSEKQQPYFRTDFRVAYRKEYKKSTLEFSLDLQNVTGNQNIFSQTYNPRTNSMANQYQQGFFPVPFIRYTF